jgi:epoxyqueuosine reductase QueG
MPLVTEPHQYECKCGTCTICVDACPGHAIKNKIWTIQTDRDELVDVAACREATLSRGKEYGKVYGTCGICVAVCPYTKKHLNLKGELISL